MEPTHPHTYPVIQYTLAFSCIPNKKCGAVRHLAFWGNHYVAGDDMHTYIYEAGIDIVRIFLPWESFQLHSVEIICKAKKHCVSSFVKLMLRNFCVCVCICCLLHGKMFPKRLRALFSGIAATLCSACGDLSIS